MPYLINRGRNRFSQVGVTSGMSVKTFYELDSYHKILMHFDGANNSTTFTNDVPSGVQPSNNLGSPIISTTQSKFGGSSLYVSATGLSFSSVPAIGTGAFTIDFWFYATVNNTNHVLNSYDSDVNTILLSSGALKLYSSGYQISGATVNIDTWYHAALVGNGGASGSRTLKLYLNGTQTGSTYTTNYNFTQTHFHLGIHSNGSSEPFRGYIDEYRLSVGIERWTANFTPPTAKY